jgi:exonuclease III
MINRMDICMIQEHWLFNCQIQLLNEIHENLNGIGKSVDDNDLLQPIQMPRGYGGTGILWKKELDHLINVIDIGNERIQCVEFTGSSRKLLLVSVYMPCKGPQNHVLEFQECVDILYEITQTYGTSHVIVFGGDFNEDSINASNNQRSRYILDFMAENYFTTVDVGDIYQLVRFRLFLDRLHYISSFIQRAVNGHCEN